MTGPGCYLGSSKTGPLWGPTIEVLAVFWLAWVGLKKSNLGWPPTTPKDPAPGMDILLAQLRGSGYAGGGI